MTGLSDYAATRLASATLPKDWQPQSVCTGSEVSVVTKSYDSEQPYDEIMRDAGYPPETWELDGPVTYSRRELDSGDLRISYRFKAKMRVGTEALNELYKSIIVDDDDFTPPQDLSEDRALVVVLADLQIGKTGSRGGTKELLERVKTRLARLKVEAKQRKAHTCVILDAGDIIEGIENVPNQAATNDLSLTDQEQLAYALVLDFIKAMAKLHQRVIVAGVSSNHAVLRKGKALTNTVNDDRGLANLRKLKIAIDQLAPKKYKHVEFYEPEPYHESLVLDVMGHGLGLVHGHQASPRMFAKWWAEQTFGAQPFAHADIAVTGHYHSFIAMPTGKSLHGKGSRWWLQAPTLDAGSDWWRNLHGDDSDPGLLIFEIDREQGFVLQSLDVL